MMHGHAVCNGFAVRTLKVVFPTIVDIGCFSDTLDLVGYSIPTIICCLVDKSFPKAKLLWRERTGQSYQGYSITRWWIRSKFEVLKQVLDLFGNVVPFLESNADFSPATHIAMLYDTQQKPYLMVGLAVTIDAGMAFIKSTYNLEGDGPLVLTC